MAETVSFVRERVLGATAGRAAACADRRLPGRAGAVQARAPARARSARGVARALHRAAAGDVLGRARPAHPRVQRDAGPAPRSSTWRARSSSPPPRTSCARRSSRSAGSSSCSRTRTSTRRPAASSWRRWREQVERLQKLSVDLLDLSRIDAGSLKLQTERRGPVRAGAVGARRVQAGARGARDGARDACFPEAGVEAHCDRERVAQIMRILLDNALRHTPEGTHVTVSANRNNGAAELTVADSGPGLSDGTRGQVFERFYTGDAARGAGLGLAIARELAERMDGTIELYTRPGKTAFKLELPQANGRQRGARSEARARSRSWRRRLLAVAGCDSSRRRARDGPRKVTTTRVQVVEGLGEKGGFDADEIYKRLSPGVVTVISIFSGGTSLSEDGGEGGQGSGFVLDGEGYIATNAHVVTASESNAQGQAGLRRVLDRRPRAGSDHRRRPERRRRAAEGRPEGPQAHAALARARPRTSWSARRSRPSAARSASASRSRSAWSPRSTATSSRSPASRSATRSRPTPPSTRATPAARC